MRMLWAWGVTLALLLGVGPAFAGPDEHVPEGDNTSGGNWFTRWFRPAPKTPEKSAAGKDEKTKDLKKDHEPRPEPAGEASALRAREEAKYLRRLECCDKLKEVADSTNDPALRKHAEELDARAFDVYTRRTALLPSSKALFDSDDKTLEKHLGQVPGIADPKADSAVYTIPGEKAPNPVKEERR
jgi:hypothetical protein